jgi:hypothetical protein
MLSSFPWPDLFVSEIGKPRVIWKDSPTQQQFVLYPASPELGNPPLEMGSFEWEIMLVIAFSLPQTNPRSNKSEGHHSGTWAHLQDAYSRSTSL